MKSYKHYLFIACVLLPCFFLLPFAFGWEGTLLHWEESSLGIKHLEFSPFDYFYNIGYSVDSFKNAFSKFSDLHFNFSSILNSLRSIANIFIALLNLLLLPASLTSSILMFLFSVIGFPMTSDNFLYNAFYIGQTLQLPYFSYLWE